MSRSACDEVLPIVTRVNQAWLEERFDDMTPYFHPDAVLSQPLFGQHVVGRSAIIDSYRQFAAMADVKEFTTGDTTADEIGESIVTSTPWRMRYAFDGKELDEHGFDILLFNRYEDAWVIVWRTIMVAA